MTTTELFQDIFETNVTITGNLVEGKSHSAFSNQQQTNEMFSEKWKKVEAKDNLAAMEDFQKNWYLTLYGFKNEEELASFLAAKKIIIDAGCGLGYKAEWFAKLSPGSTVIGIDFSEAVYIAAHKYTSVPNLLFVHEDIANTNIKKGIVDYVSCDQVIHHTENPGQTFAHLSELLAPRGELACYVYAKKALPRELLDDYFRKAVHNFSKEQLWEFSKQMTELGKRLSKLDVKINSPDIPLLGIKEGEYDIQRFIYWNFMKCFWREDWSTELCDSTNFDWYSPSNAARYSVEEFNIWGTNNNLVKVFSHTEEACHTGRFKKI